MNNIAKAIFVLFIGISTNVFSQLEKDQHELTDVKKEKMADKLLKEGSYYSAVDYYNEVWLNDTTRYDLKYKMGLAYYFSRDYFNAEPWFQKAVNLEPKAPTLAFFYLGQCQRHNEKYADAKQNFSKFKKIRYKGADAKNKKKLNANFIKSCDFALQNKKKPVYATIENLGDKINSNYTDFAPVATSDSTLLYASLRSDTVLHAHAHSTEFYPVHLYESTKENNEWKEPVELSRNFNKHFSHSANAVYTPDGKTMYYTQCKPVHSVVKCHIYKSEFVNGEWTHPKKLHDKVNSMKYTSTQPALGYYTKKKRKTVTEIPVLYFVSNRTGTKGGLDIWYSEMNDKGHFSRPKNCGSRINTVGDEISPFYNQKEQTLYFSSTYHHGFGGLDIFKTTGKTKTWKKAENLGYNMNSSLDDTYYTTDSTGKHGYLVSNRPGGHALTSETCCDDIYHYDLNDIPTLPLDGFVFDKNDSLQNPMTNASVSLYMLREGEPDSLINTINVDDKNTHYGFEIQPNEEYYLKGDKEGYDSEKVSFNTVDLFEIDTLKMNIPIWAKKVEPVDSTPVVAVVDENEVENNTDPAPLTKGFVLKNVLHDFDISNHSAGTGVNIDDVIKVMKDNPFLIISIESHTDSKGSDEYNMKLSQKRATSAKSYLIRKGISTARLKAAYFGESRPVAPNENADGSDNPEGRSKNRRTEFKVVSNDKK